MNRHEHLLAFLKELRDSADVQYKIFTEGSCFRLYKIIAAIYPEALPYWSDRDNHCITHLDGKFYDIGGEITTEYTIINGYCFVPLEHRPGYELLKYLSNGESSHITIEKYVTNKITNK